MAANNGIVPGLIGPAYANLPKPRKTRKPNKVNNKAQPKKPKKPRKSRAKDKSAPKKARKPRCRSWSPDAGVTVIELVRRDYRKLFGKLKTANKAKNDEKERIWQKIADECSTEAKPRTVEEVITKWRNTRKASKRVVDNGTGGGKRKDIPPCVLLYLDYFGKSPGMRGVDGGVDVGEDTDSETDDPTQAYSDDSDDSDEETDGYEGADAPAGEEEEEDDEEQDGDETEDDSEEVPSTARTLYVTQNDEDPGTALVSSQPPYESTEDTEPHEMLPPDMRMPKEVELQLPNGEVIKVPFVYADKVPEGSQPLSDDITTLLMQTCRSPAVAGPSGVRKRPASVSSRAGTAAGPVEGSEPPGTPNSPPTKRPTTADDAMPVVGKGKGRGKGKSNFIRPGKPTAPKGTPAATATTSRAGARVSGLTAPRPLLDMAAIDDWQGIDSSDESDPENTRGTANNTTQAATQDRPGGTQQEGTQQTQEQVLEEPAEVRNNPAPPAARRNRRRGGPVARGRRPGAGRGREVEGQNTDGPLRGGPRSATLSRRRKVTDRLDILYERALGLDIDQKTKAIELQALDEELTLLKIQALKRDLGIDH